MAKTQRLQQQQKMINIKIKTQNSVPANYVNIYQSTFYRLLGVNGCARELIDFLIEEMNGDNIVNNNKYTRIKFLNMSSNGEHIPSNWKYKDSTVNQAFHELSVIGLLKVKNKGTFRVDPKLFWKNKSEKKRESAIRMELIFEENKPAKINVDRSGNFKVKDQES